MRRQIYLNMGTSIIIIMRVLAGVLCTHPTVPSEFGSVINGQTKVGQFHNGSLFLAGEEQILGLHVHVNKKKKLPY